MAQYKAARGPDEDPAPSSSADPGPERHHQVAGLAEAAHRQLQQAQTVTELHQAIDAFRAAEPQHGHVAFLNATMERVAEIDEPLPLATYDNLLNIFPKTNTFKTSSLLDAIWPRQTLQGEAALRVLNHMETDGLIPQASTHAILLRTFGAASAPVKKVTYMAYWMQRFFGSNPFALPLPLPQTDEAWLHLALRRFAGKDATVHGARLRIPRSLFLNWWLKGANEPGFQADVITTSHWAFEMMPLDMDDAGRTNTVVDRDIETWRRFADRWMRQLQRLTQHECQTMIHLQ
ncbi:uncharacterized protein MONBRDRAFT_28699 [Monosiga brevicollis MX1]|uniref:ECSIT N-terminal domain-containing protein n=1 Tax=Monosiga brevicollis TaxID=81824 RepID=A9V8X9_MONBE|nr:uncharacterized protein MONBRDRAFT_28699 [Monosiga brevicollis MX1]EDQ85953.1 predicted protein [Monosiga brevicollis MX1]|eukprot:XP_001749147.1 hypothetical protein [Monosiga brevicollis MX1]